MPGSRLFYSDGSEYSGPPEDSPRDGLCLVAQERADPMNASPEILFGDWLAFHDGRWWSHTDFGIMHELSISCLDWRAVRPGRFVAPEMWESLMERASRVVF